MTPELWTVVGTSLGSVLALGALMVALHLNSANRLDALRKEVADEFKAVRAEIDDKFEKQRLAIAGLAERIARLEGALETLTDRRDAA